MASFTTEQLQQIHQMLSNNNKTEKKEQKSTPTGEDSSSTAAANTSGIHLINIADTNEPWLLDSGATHHIVCTKSYFTHNIENLNSVVQLPNLQTAMITHIGSIKIN